MRSINASVIENHVAAAVRDFSTVSSENRVVRRQAHQAHLNCLQAWYLGHESMETMAKTLSMGTNFENSIAGRLKPVPVSAVERLSEFKIRSGYQGTVEQPLSASKVHAG